MGLQKVLVEGQSASNQWRRLPWDWWMASFLLLSNSKPARMQRSECQGLAAAETRALPSRVRAQRPRSG